MHATWRKSHGPEQAVKKRLSPGDDVTDFQNNENWKARGDDASRRKLALWPRKVERTATVHVASIPRSGTCSEEKTKPKMMSLRYKNERSRKARGDDASRRKLVLRPRKEERTATVHVASIPRSGPGSEEKAKPWMTSPSFQNNESRRK